ncbi:hypothetical protein MtrunA17_Chr5g0438561 [Medicago truncatula]|uniref:Uncharacterized protein n=1 Tax=Medicago truncatula TaxID=3880 RepID=A0A396HVA2_MEDTR|nr:hypothetical protein MtrunA17_Chr5g0438561 [Medicago truncatula]
MLSFSCRRSKRIKDKHRGRWQSTLVRRKSNMAKRKWKSKRGSQFYHKLF